MDHCLSLIIVHILNDIEMCVFLGCVNVSVSVCM